MEKGKPLVSIYTITRNRADLLPRAMRSVLSQTYHNIEYIVIDSESTDNTAEVVKSFNDERIRYVRLNENKTFGTCINMAFKLANGKYVTELDDDDEYHLDKIEKQVEFFEKLPEDYGMVYCWMTYFDNKTGQELSVHKSECRGSVLSEAVSKPIVSGTPTLLVRKDVFEKIGGYKEADEIGVESDWEFATRICEFYKVDFVPESLVNVFVNHSHTRMSDHGYYRDLAKRNITFHNYFLQRFSKEFKANPKLEKYHLKVLCYSYIQLNDQKSFRKCYRRLLRYNWYDISLYFLPLRYRLLNKKNSK